ncbi:hypothetical protein IWX90DRAFT_481153 [Phyllosticta citrichinensis]|uniref:BRCT domain-containing protein n=1 Tax=Phyllosticta citrichinensis TaxID=1130410 RepID=A0ABR1XHD0_9PEZI
MAHNKPQDLQSISKSTFTNDIFFAWQDCDEPPPSAQPLPPSPKAPTPQPATETRNATHHNGILKPPQSSRNFFDPWNSSSTGHQRAENRLSGSTSWRASRNAKLGAQFRGGAGGGKRVADTVGAGSEEFGTDGRRQDGGWERGASGLRERGQLAIWEVGRETKRRRVSDEWEEEKNSDGQHRHGQKGQRTRAAEEQGGDGAPKEEAGDLDEDAEEEDDAPLPPERQIFRNLCFYINGSTAPTISDHKLKRLLATHGATTSVALGRRSVSHVIIGRTGEGGVGGGLAGGKLQKEIERVGGKGVKYVPVEWVVESVKRGKRLPEAGFAHLKVGAPAGQRSVLGMFKQGDRT